MNKKIVLVSLFGLLAIAQIFANPSIADLKADQLLKRNKISGDAITRMYRGMGLIRPLYIPQQELVKFKDNPINLKTLFEKYHMVTQKGDLIWFTHHPWDDQDWLTAFKILAKRAKNKEKIGQISLYDVPKLLHNTQLILKSFLSPIAVDSMLKKKEGRFDLFYANNSQFFAKQGLNRLYTYAKLERVIQEKKLSHIHLPLKVIVLQDRKSGKYITGQRASGLLDNLIKMFTLGPSGGIGEVEASISYLENKYKLFILAHVQVPSRGELSQAALNDLVVLIKAAPFDLGYGNIFSDSNGDAVIIDTEFKGEPVAHTLPKLSRYGLSRAKL